MEVTRLSHPVESQWQNPCSPGRRKSGESRRNVLEATYTHLLLPLASLTRDYRPDFIPRPIAEYYRTPIQHDLKARALPRRMPKAARISDSVLPDICHSSIPKHTTLRSQSLHCPAMHISLTLNKRFGPSSTCHRSRGVPHVRESRDVQ